MLAEAYRVTLFSLIITGLTVVAFPGTAIGCFSAQMDFSPLTVEAAVSIFRGKIVEYQIIEGNFVKLRFDVTATYRGEKKEHWILLWANSTFGVPRDIAEYQKYYGRDTVVGVAPTGISGLASAPISSFITPSSQEVIKHPWVMQASCAPPIMVKWNDGYQFKYLMEIGAIPRIDP
jgi:hypothetical protein